MIMAIVKANGYGHGALPISLEIEDTVDMFGAAIMEEALPIKRRWNQETYSHTWI